MAKQGKSDARARPSADWARRKTCSLKDLRSAALYRLRPRTASAFAALMILSRVAFETRVTFAGRGMPIPKIQTIV